MGTQIMENLGAYKYLANLTRQIDHSFLSQRSDLYDTVKEFAVMVFPILCCPDQSTNFSENQLINCGNFFLGQIEHI